LRSSDITEKEATFCLLDQRTFECDWATVEKLARFKTAGHKIELFYFLANGWLERALAAQKDLDKLARWWGNDDWPLLRKMSREERRDELVLRIKRDLGYQSVKPLADFGTSRWRSGHVFHDSCDRSPRGAAADVSRISQGCISIRAD
jgi:three-Cys-motif partner protein